MMEMMEAYAKNEELKAMFAGAKPDETLVLNRGSRLVTSLVAMAGQEGKKEDVSLLCRQLYDLAMMSHRPLTSEEMTAFLDRSNLLLEKLAGYEKKKKKKTLGTLSPNPCWGIMPQTLISAAFYAAENKV